MWHYILIVYSKVQEHHSYYFVYKEAIIMVLDYPNKIIKTVLFY